MLYDTEQLTLQAHKYNVELRFDSGHFTTEIPNVQVEQIRHYNHSLKEVLTKKKCC